MIYLFVFGIVVGLYGLALLAILYFWKSIPLQGGNRSLNSNQVSVIIALRNEGTRMPELIDGISNLKSENLREVILVNDHSIDNTDEWLKSIEDHEFISSLSLTSSEGKKAAIARGIQHSQGDIILTTDGDCLLDPNWVDHMIIPFENGANFAFGPVTYQSNGSVFSEIQRMELVILQVFSGATWQMRIPTMCNGANLAYRKSEFQKLNGFTDHARTPSGDDEFTMHKMYNADPASVRFVKPTKPDVSTFTEETIQAFFHQRIRWSGKWKNYNHNPSRILALLIFIFNLSFTLIPVMFLTGMITWNSAIILLVGKGLFEWILLSSVKGYFQLNIRLIPFLLLSLIYPYYVVLFGVVSHFGSFYWKGRKFAND